MRLVVLAAACMLHIACGLNYTGETVLLDAAPETTNRRHATAVTFGELGVFDFRGDGRARVALELGAFTSEKDSKTTTTSTRGKRQGAGDRPVRSLEGVELDHVYLIFAKARAVNNFVARLHTAQRRRSVGVENDELAALMLCSDVGSWLESEFVAPISELRRPEKKKEQKPPVVVEEDAKQKQQQDEGKPRISFISAATPTASKDTRPLPTRVTGMHRRASMPATTLSANTTVSSRPPAASETPALLGSAGKASDVFLVEYEWEWHVQHGGEYAVVIANCAATTVQFKYNLIMANRWGDGQWTNVPAGWMPVQRVYPAFSYALWGVATVAWAVWLGSPHLPSKRGRGMGRPLVGVVAGSVPVLRFLSSLADQSRFGGAWGGASYEATMVVVSTSLVDALAGAAQTLVLLALSKGWGVVRGRLAGGEKRLVPGLVVFGGVATLYDGATRGGGLLAVCVLQVAAVWYAGASIRHTRRAHGVQLLRLVSRNERALRAWHALQQHHDQLQQQAEDGARDAWSTAQALEKLSRERAEAVQQGGAALALVWSAAQKDTLLRRVEHWALPMQALDAVVTVCAALAVPAHYAYVGLLVAQAAHWLAFAGMLAVLALGAQGAPSVRLPAVPAIAVRRSIPLPPPPQQAGAGAGRMRPPLGRLRLLRSATPFGPSGVQPS